MFRTLIFALLSVWLPGAACAREPETGFLDRKISAGGGAYHYQVFVPLNWDKHRRWPVILSLHRSGQRGDDGVLQTDVGLGHAIRENSANFPFVVVMPQCRKEKIWSDPEMETQVFHETVQWR